MRNSTYPSERSIQYVEVDSLDKALLAYRRVVLLGEPGAGKTAALLRLIYSRITNCRGSARWTPIYVPLSGYTGPESTLLYIANYVTELGPHVAVALQSGAYVLLLDGLDEMPRNGFAERVQRIQELLTCFKNMPVVLTSRERDYNESLNLHKLKIAPFDPSRQHEYLCHYLGGVQGDELYWRMAGAEATAQWSQWTGRGASVREFWIAWLKTTEAQNDNVDAIRSSAAHIRAQDLPPLLTFTANPLLLMATAQVYRAKGEVPQTPYAILDAFIDTLLERERVRRGQDSWPGTDVVRRGLADLALSMLLQAEGCSAVAALTSSKESARPAYDVLDIGRGATLLDGQTGQARFRHRQIQEQLAAQAWLAQLELEGDLRCFWLHELSTPNEWHDSLIRLTEVMLDLAPIVEFLITTDPIMAARCVYARGANQPPLTIIEKIQDALYRAATTTTASAAERIAAGNALNILSDRRPGIGLLPDGVPDIEWCEVPAGFFVRSGSAYISSSMASEQPIRKEYLGGFAISKYPISNRQYQAYIEETGGGRNWRDSWAKDDYKQAKEDFYGYFPFEDDSDQWNHPVVRESWHSAWGFCRWLEKKLGYPIEIPTQEQWEKAVLGLDGKGIAAEMHLACPANYNSTLPIGIFPEYAGPFGVMEITDCFQEYTYTEYKTRQPTLRTDGDEVIEVIDTFVDDTMSYLSTGDPWCAAVHIGAYCQDPSNSCGFRVVRLYPEVENDVETDEYHGSTAAPDPIDRCSDSEPSDTANEFGGEHSFWPVDDFPTRYIAIDDLSDELTIPP